MSKKAKLNSGETDNGNRATANTQPAASITIEDILRGTSHALTIFKPKTIAGLSIFLKRGKPYLICYASGKERPAKPEEIFKNATPAPEFPHKGS